MLTFSHVYYNSYFLFFLLNILSIFHNTVKNINFQNILPAPPHSTIPLFLDT